MLATRGYAVSVVRDGAAAVDAASDAAGVDLVLMDLQMPVLDGLSATRAIREHETSSRRRRTPIIGLTANAITEDAARCRAAGMDAHVAKPIAWPMFFATLDALLRPAPAEPPILAADETLAMPDARRLTPVLPD